MNVVLAESYTVQRRFRHRWISTMIFGLTNTNMSRLGLRGISLGWIMSVWIHVWFRCERPSPPAFVNVFVSVFERRFFFSAGIYLHANALGRRAGAFGPMVPSPSLTRKARLRVSSWRERLHEHRHQLCTTSCMKTSAELSSVQPIYNTCMCMHVDISSMSCCMYLPIFYYKRSLCL